MQGDGVLPVAVVFSGLTGREIQVVEQPPAALVSIMEDMVAGHFGTLYGEMSEAITNGTVELDAERPLVGGTTPGEATLKALLSG